jgi:hypothetical protein
MPSYVGQVVESLWSRSRRPFGLVSFAALALVYLPPAEEVEKAAALAPPLDVIHPRKQHRKTGVRSCSPQAVSEDGQSSGGKEMRTLLATIGVALAIGALIAATWPIGTEFVAGIALNGLD